MRVWDLPTRVFHWLLAVCVIGSVVTAKIGGNAMVWHFRFGYAIFTLLAFRLVWGFVGGHWSRFASFVAAPSATLALPARRAAAPSDHSTSATTRSARCRCSACSAFLVAQVATGLFADDEIANTGPLIKFVSGATQPGSTGVAQDDRPVGHDHAGRAARRARSSCTTVRGKRNLVRPMISGDKLLPAGVPASVDNLPHARLARGARCRCACCRRRLAGQPGRLDWIALTQFAVGWTPLKSAC